MDEQKEDQGMYKQKVSPVPMYGFSLASYVSMMTWWPMGIAFIV